MLKSVLLDQISAKLNMKPEYEEYKKANDVSVFIAKGIVEDIR